MSEQDHDWWADKLQRRFFGARFSGEPITFCVDREELTALTGNSGDDSATALAEAVASRVMPDYRFHRIRNSAYTWRAKGANGPPPMLPLLALNVLVASEMTPGPDGGAPPFYSPLCSLLGGEPTTGSPGNYADAVPDCWELLRWWLDEHLKGAHGLSTVTRHEHFTYIGYAMQQATLRGSDRLRIFRFFKAIGLIPGESDTTGSELRNALAIWAKRQQNGERLHRLATDPSLQRYAEALLERLAATWDGTIGTNQDGHPSATLRLTIPTQPDFYLNLVCEHDERLPESAVFSQSNGRVTQVSANTLGKFYEPQRLIDADAKCLEKGITLTADSFEAHFDAADAYAFRRGNDPGLYPNWVSTRQIRFGETHLLLVRSEGHREILDWLRKERAEGELKPGVTQRLPEGWLLIANVKLEQRPSHDPPPPIADLLRSGNGSWLRLVGGLKFSGFRHAYLTGGAPLVALPSDTNLRLSLSQVGSEFPPLGLNPLRLEYPLHELSLEAAEYELALGSARHELADGSRAIRFDLSEGLAESPSALVGSATHSSEGGRPVSGLRAGVAQPKPPVTVPTSQTPGEVLLGPDGQCTPVLFPLWLEYVAGPLSWDQCDAWNCNPVWRIVPVNGDYHAELLRAEEPGSIAADSNAAGWLHRATLTDERTKAVELWNRYLKACE